jgi:heme oxygenase
MTSDSTPDILSHLRTATAGAHHDLEETINIPEVCASQQGYVKLLECFMGFFEPFEKVLQAVPGWVEKGFHWPERTKTPMLQADLSALGRSEAQIAALPRCVDLPRPENLAEAFGCAYVLEGSTLGGRHILGVLAQSAIPQEAQHYFSSYGEEVGARWREFMAMLSDFPKTETKSMTSMAVRTFDNLGAWFYECQ